MRMWRNLEGISNEKVDKKFVDRSNENTDGILAEEKLKHQPLIEKFDEKSYEVFKEKNRDTQNRFKETGTPSFDLNHKPLEKVENFQKTPEIRNENNVQGEQCVACLRGKRK